MFDLRCKILGHKWQRRISGYLCERCRIWNYYGPEKK